MPDTGQNPSDFFFWVGEKYTPIPFWVRIWRLGPKRADWLAGYVATTQRAFFFCTDKSGRVQPTDARRWGQFLVPKRLKWNGWKPLDRAEAWVIEPWDHLDVSVGVAAFRRLFGNEKTTFREVSPSWPMFGERHETWWQLLKSTRRAIPTRANQTKSSTNAGIARFP